MQRIALGICLTGLMIAGCQSTVRTIDLGRPPEPVLSTRRPAPVVQTPPPPVTTVVPAPAPAPSLRGTTIVVDPGHGGDDPGALGRGALPEKAINLDIALKVAELLQDRGARVLMTRNGDRFISLDGRAAMADRVRADLLVSIHSDSARRSTAEGMTVYVGRGSSADSRRAAQRIAAAVQRAGLEFRGVQSAGYRVLVGHSRPAVLVECGFLTNHSEARQLSSGSYRTRVAEAIAEGVAENFGG